MKTSLLITGITYLPRRNGGGGFVLWPWSVMLRVHKQHGPYEAMAEVLTRKWPSYEFRIAGQQTCTIQGQDFYLLWAKAEPASNVGRNGYEAVNAVAYWCETDRTDIPRAYWHSLE